MDISQNGIDLIKKFEGCVLQAYDDYNGKVVSGTDKIIGTLTIGYGHTKGVYVGQAITQDEAERLLLSDLDSYVSTVNTYVDNGIISFVPNQNEFDSLVSFCYNVGSSALAQLCNARTREDIPKHITYYCNVNGKPVQGLINRRNAELELFLKPCEIQNVSRETIQSIGDDYMSKIYQNGSTTENVYADESLTIRIGSLNPYEKCQAIADINGKIVVLYTSPLGKKAGFTKYRGGL